MHEMLATCYLYYNRKFLELGDELYFSDPSYMLTVFEIYRRRHRAILKLYQIFAVFVEYPGLYLIYYKLSFDFLFRAAFSRLWNMRFFFYDKSP